MKRRHVVLVNPKICSPRSVRLPLSLLALGAVLEGEYEYRLVDGNLDPQALNVVLQAIEDAPRAMVGLTVMPGPQVGPAIEISRAVRRAHPDVPIVWGGYFPTLYPEATLNTPYVDFVVRGQGEGTLLELLQRLEGGLEGAGSSEYKDIRGLSWKDEGEIRHNPERALRPPESYPPLPYDKIVDAEPYMRPSFMGSRTGVYQAALGCRYRCEFCGVVSMWNGKTHLGPEDRLFDEITAQRDRFGINAMQFYDHNFFDREESSLPTLEVLAKTALPWWCYARADTMANFSTSTWESIRKSRLSMAYIGAEAASDEVLKRMKKGSRVEHTFEVARRCREYGVVPEFSFVLGGPEDPEGEVEKTFQFIKRLKSLHPECEVILYFYTPTPRRAPGLPRPESAAFGAKEVDLPVTPEEWTEPQWLDFVCHQNAPWLSSRMRQRVHDFAFVLGCRFPTVQDYSLPAWGKTLLKSMASWRYASGVYARPWELRCLAEGLRLRQPQHESL